MANIKNTSWSSSSSSSPSTNKWQCFSTELRLNAKAKMTPQLFSPQSLWDDGHWKPSPYSSCNNSYNLELKMISGKWVSCDLLNIAKLWIGICWPGRLLNNTSHNTEQENIRRERLPAPTIIFLCSKILCCLTMPVVLFFLSLKKCQ